MIQIQLVNNLIETERKIKFFEEKRKYYRFESYMNFLAAPTRSQRKRNNPFTLISSHHKGSQASRNFIEALNSKIKGFHE